MNGAVALVTGADNPHGIGRACVRALAARRVRVACTVRPGGDEADGAREAGAAAVLEADLADPLAPDALLDAVAAALGPASVLVNNAAHSELDGWEALDAAGLDAHWAVNARAPALLAAGLARRHARGAPGRIVNLTSGQFLGPMPRELAYAASKGALEALTVQLAAELAPLGITVNAVGPGPTDTGWMDDALRERLRSQFPTGRIGRAEDAARLVAFLCSEEAAWITGQVIHSEGGFMRR
jgi:3-oxoacyl-[acyl-carrier protein] reductase